jgi:lipid-A-disaccharide synthase
VYQLKATVERLLCIFPFEEEFFRRYGVPAHYIGHPLVNLVRATATREEFFQRHQLDLARPLVALLPGSRRGEITRHLPLLQDTVRLISAKIPGVQFVLGTPASLEDSFIRAALPDVHIAAGESWNLMAHADLALLASGTVTVEAALLGVPMATFYRVSTLTWEIGRRLVNVPFYSMVNLVAGRKIVAELIQPEATGENLAAEAVRLLSDEAARSAMREQLGDVRRRLSTAGDPMARAADHVLATIRGTDTR